jgi:hypothetical protein
MHGAVSTVLVTSTVPVAEAELFQPFYFQKRGWRRRKRQRWRISGGGAGGARRHISADSGGVAPRLKLGFGGISHRRP